jgi:hypothetical protein
LTGVLALEQFGYNVGEEPEKAWTPEKLAVFLSRKLNIDKEAFSHYISTYQSCSFKP